MNEHWHNISDIRCDSGKLFSANVVAAAYSPWFSGHFPEEPILPGIAQLSMVVDLIQKCCEKNNLSIKKLKKIKFKSLVKPEEILHITVTLKENSQGTYSFKIVSNGNTASAGLITAL
ncbi:MAG: hypothetical protein JW864_10770 [Spirochaetes bacterium]|nr:hypothetical protein [Spirochaetota bacterium]